MCENLEKSGISFQLVSFACFHDFSGTFIPIICFPAVPGNKKLAVDIHSLSASEYFYYGKMNWLSSQMVHCCKSIVNRFLSLLRRGEEG